MKKLPATDTGLYETASLPRNAQVYVAMVAVVLAVFSCTAPTSVCSPI